MWWRFFLFSLFERVHNRRCWARWVDPKLCHLSVCGETKHTIDKRSLETVLWTHIRKIFARKTTKFSNFTAQNCIEKLAVECILCLARIGSGNGYGLHVWMDCILCVVVQNIFGTIYLELYQCYRISQNHRWTEFQSKTETF
jgi:hypothetical protein